MKEMSFKSHLAARTPTAGTAADKEMKYTEVCLLLFSYEILAPRSRHF